MTFKYSPLEPGEFRLILLHPRFSNTIKETACREELPISCTVDHFSRDKSPPYIALSYTWGDATNRVSIRLNDSIFNVTENLHAALQHIRKDDSNIMIWIDALCINQEDSTEKTEQVKIMGDIFASAKHTRAWLGPSKSGSDEAIAELIRIGDIIIEKQLVELMIEFFKLPPTAIERYQELDLQIKDCLAPLVEDAIENQPRTLTFLNDAGELLSREYWRRVWILQEVIVSSQIIFQCGKATISFPQLYAAGGCFTALLGVHVIDLHIRKNGGMQSSTRFTREIFDFCLAIGTNASLMAPTTKIFGARMRYQQARSNISWEGNNLLQLLARIHVTSALKASCSVTDPKDRIFSLLGVANDSAQLGILPDYDPSKTCSQIYTKAARAIIKSGQLDLLSLSQPQGKASDVPSWVPDWRAEWILRPSGQLPWDTAFQAFSTFKGFGAFKTPPTEKKESRDQLLLYGYQVDVIEALGIPWCPDYLEGCAGPSNTQAISEYLNGIANLCAQSDIKYEDNNIPIYSNEKDRSLAHKRVPVADQEEYGTGFIRRAADDSDEGYAHVMQDIKQDIANNLQMRSSLSMSYRNMMGWQRDRRPFLSKKGYVGLAPLQVEEGDEIVLFLNAKFPYVLRKLKSRADRAYSFVGEAYVHGIMYGEFVARGVAGDEIGSFTLI